MTTMHAEQTTDIKAAAHRIRAQNLGLVFNGKIVPSKGRALSPYQIDALAALRYAGMTAHAVQNGTIAATYLAPSPSGGYTEEWRHLVTHRDLVSHLGSAYST